MPLLRGAERWDSLPHLKIALSYVGLREIGPNRHPAIDRWNQRVGVPVGSSYCASFVSFCLDSAGALYPPIRTAWSRSFTRYGVPIGLSDLKVKRGSILVWIRQSGGHIGFVHSVIGVGKWKTVEANTSQGYRGSQYNGDGIWIRYRKYEPFNTFRITHYVPVRYW